MEAIELELFNDETTVKNSIPKATSVDKASPTTQPTNPQKVLEKALNSIFISPQEENAIAKDESLIDKYNIQAITEFILDKFKNLADTYDGKGNGLEAKKALVCSIFPSGLLWNYPGYSNFKLARIIKLFVNLTAMGSLTVPERGLEPPRF